MHLQVVDGKVGMVGLRSKVIGSIQIQVALLQLQGSSALRPLHTDTCRKVHAVRHDDRAVGSNVGKSGQEVQVLCVHFKVHAPATFYTVGQIPKLASSTQRKSSGELGRKT